MSLRFFFSPADAVSLIYTNIIAFAGYVIDWADPVRLDQNGSECDTDPGHEVADVGGLSGIPERDMFAAGQRVQVRPPRQELPGGKRQSYRLF